MCFGMDGGADVEEGASGQGKHNLSVRTTCKKKRKTKNLFFPWLNRVGRWDHWS